MAEPPGLRAVRSLRVDGAAAERRAARYEALSASEGDALVRRLLRAVSLLDLTALAGDDTPATVRRLCAAALRPLPRSGLVAPGGGPVRVAAVCVWPVFVGVARRVLRGSDVAVATVAAGFPAGLSPLRARIDEVRACAEDGADEIDVVIARHHVLRGEWGALHDEVRAFREAAGPARLKTILATGELRTLTNVARAATVCIAAGADFVKSSTGKEAVNATLPAGVAMARAIRDHHARTGRVVGLKPAGGIRAARQALAWMALVEGELGEDWLRPERFRIGASGLLGALDAALAALVRGDALDPDGERAGAGY